MQPKTMRVKPWGEDQGEFVVINEADFDPAVHTAFDAADKQGDDSGDGKVTAAQLREALTARGIAFKANAPKAELQALLDAADKQGD